MTKRTVSFVFRISTSKPVPFTHHHCHLLKSYLVAGPWGVMLAGHSLSFLFSSLIEEPQLCLSKQWVPITGPLFPHLPCDLGVERQPSCTVLVSRTEAGLSIQLFSWVMGGTFLLPLCCPFAFFILPIWNTDVRPGEEAALLSPWGSKPYSEGDGAERRKGLSPRWLQWPALACPPWDFLTCNTNLYF